MEKELVCIHCPMGCRLTVTMEGSEKVCEIAQKYVDAISRDVLADSLTVGKAEGVVSQWDINGEDAVFGVAKISK